MINQQSDKNKFLRNAILGASAILTIANVIFLLYFLISKNDPDARLVSCIGACFLSVLPILLEIISKKIKVLRLSNFALIFYLIYIFFASFLGNVIFLYKHMPHYDKLMHSAFGYVGCVIGLLIICKTEKYNNLSPVFVCIVCFLISMALGGIWEMFEFIGDNFMGQTAQGAKIISADGKTFVDVSDSMLDIICNFVGASVFAVNFIIEKATRKNVLINRITADFSN